MLGKISNIKCKILMFKRGEKVSEEIKRKISEANKGKKATDEQRKHMSEAHKGKPAWNKGKPSPMKGIPRKKEVRENISKAKKGKSNGLNGRKYSDEHKQHLREANLGDKNPMYGKHQSEESKIKKSAKLQNIPIEEWKGFIAKVEIRIRNTYQYLNFRTKVFQRDNYTCQECNVKGGELNVHHIEKVSTELKKFDLSIPFEELIYQLEVLSNIFNEKNAITYCKSCHKAIHKVRKAA